MPLHFPHLHHKEKDKEPVPSFAPTSGPSSPRLHPSSPLLPRTSLPASDAPAPTSILRRTGAPPSPHASITTELTGSSSSASAYLSKRLSRTINLDRSDTIDTVFSDDEAGAGGSGSGAGSSTPATSVSSLEGQCPLPSTTGAHKFPFFVMTLSSTSTLSFIALPLHMRPRVLDAVQRAWRRGVAKTSQVEYAPELMRRHREKGCEGGVWEVSLKDNCWMPKSEDKVSSKRILLYLMTEFAREGYSLTSSFRTSAKDTGKDTLIFLRGEPDPDPVFFAVAFHSSDRIWIIDAEADVGEALEQGIRATWVDGIRDARTRERHCREIRLRGAPWTAHSTAALISARCIHLCIMKNVTHYSRGYDFVGSVDMADAEEGEMPLTIYRRKWAQSRAVWGDRDGVDELDHEPISTPAPDKEDWKGERL
ncbi:hypothetical protein Q5752_001273 [Cryptotrichosporon argae]